MNIAGMVPSQMILKPDEKTLVRSCCGKPVDGLTVNAQNQAVAPKAGPVTLSFPIVLPKTASITGGRLTITASAPATIKNGERVIGKVDANKPAELALTKDALTGGTDYVIDEIPFRDFYQTDLSVQIDAPQTETAKLNFSATIEYQLPVESASDYLNYIMTQA